MSEALSQREFDTWRELDNARWERLETHMTTQTATNLDVEKRLSAVETSARGGEARSLRRASFLSTAVSAVVSGVVSALIGSYHRG